MDYTKFDYLWPPRPEKAIPRSMIKLYEQRGWIAEPKLNGTCSIIAVGPDKSIISMNRHNEVHKAWAPTAASTAAFKKVKGEGWFVFVAELMHSKVPGLRDTNYIHDILVHDGKSLAGVTLQDRKQLLERIFLRKGMDQTITHHVIDQNTWLAKSVTKDFVGFYDALLPIAMVEGLVLKNPKAPLNHCFRPTSNAGWSLKCRQPHKNYSY